MLTLVLVISPSLLEMLFVRMEAPLQPLKELVRFHPTDNHLVRSHNSFCFFLPAISFPSINKHFSVRENSSSVLRIYNAASLDLCRIFNLSWIIYLADGSKALPLCIFNFLLVHFLFMLKALERDPGIHGIFGKKYVTERRNFTENLCTSPQLQPWVGANIYVLFSCRYLLSNLLKTKFWLQWMINFRWECQTVKKSQNLLLLSENCECIFR